VVERDGQISNLNQVVVHLEQELNELRDSRSWRLTRPIRFFGWAMRGLRKKSRTAFHVFSKAVYHKLPFPPQIKWKLRKQFYQALSKSDTLVASSPIPVPLNPFIDEKQIWSDFESNHLRLDTVKNPKVSIIIPVFGKCNYTYQCLKSIAENTVGIDYEVIIVDDFSADRTEEMLSLVSGIRVIRNKNNQGFIFSRNVGAKQARGEYLVFLNNDTVVTAGWLKELVDTFKIFPDVGLVGAKLLHPDGRLQEAGGIVWRDASVWNYGRLGDPNKPEYNYLREVDYCSGTCIMVPKTLFADLGGFDERYVPAYCEDADLAFQIRQKGFKVLYQPLSCVVNFEGISSGTDLSSGVKKYQIVNQEKFQKKWAEVLKNHRQNGENPDYEKERNVQKRILVIDACTLTPDQDSGSLDTFNHIKIFQSLGYKVTFIPDNLVYVDHYTADLQRIGVECLYQPYIGSVATHLEKHGLKYDVVMLYRPHVAEPHIENVRKYCPQAKIIFETVDLHYVREQRQAQIEDNEAMAERASITKRRELDVAAKADCTIVLSPIEKELLLRENPQLRVALVRPPRYIHGSDRPFEKRADILYVGGFQHLPNVDAVLFFVKEIFPHIQKRLGKIKFYVIGSKVPQSILQLASDSVVIMGHVKDISPCFGRCRISVAPIRYGAGVKGKILSALGHGLPSVATSMACEGMGLEHGKDILIADEPEKFAEAVEVLYLNCELWQTISRNGLDTIKKGYSFEVVREKLREVLDTRISLGGVNTEISA